MITNITYSVVFPISGVALQGSFTPQPALTAVVGPNGVGKTFTSIELTRYLLYGKAALRGPATDYKKLDATGTFTINGSEYTISRSAKKESITDTTGTVLAVGADAVTKKVEELMGYGLGVFDVCNASVQKQADIFGQMRPAERKRMIDEVVNITSTEVVEKACRAEGKTLQREAEAMTRQLVAPEEPEKPAGYMPVEKLEPEYDALRTLYDQAQAIASQMAPAFEPKKPSGRRPDPEQIAKVEREQAEHERVDARRLTLTQLVEREVDSRYTQEQLEAASQRLLLKDMMDKQVECPECGNEFVPGHGHVELPEGPDLSSQEIRTFSNNLRTRQEQEDAAKELKALPKTKDVGVKLADMRALDAQWQVYDQLIEQQQFQVRRNVGAEAALRKLGEIPKLNELEYLREVLSESRYYERQMDDYAKQKERYETLSNEIAELGRLAVEFRKGGEALSDARATLKTLLAPALGRVASSLITDMTHGVLHTVEVDEDMEITVNGQALETLSGGGETVANIALRLALGQVLVAQTFPVFLGDEMDADADDTRREAVAEALSALIANKYLKQVILVTHRSVDIADHVLDLGNTESE